MHLFTVYRRNVDEPQFEGVVFSDGRCVLRCLAAAVSVSVWDSFEDAMRIHGHPEYGSEILWHRVEHGGSLWPEGVYRPEGM